MPRHRCPSCRCGERTSEDTLIKWVNEGVKSEGMNYFCEPKCRTCSGGDDGRCPRDPYCKKHVLEKKAA